MKTCANPPTIKMKEDKVKVLTKPESDSYFTMQNLI